MMTQLAARYPGYGWEHNQGYATREHRTAIRRLGPDARSTAARSWPSSARSPATSCRSTCWATRRPRPRPTSCSSASSSRSWPTTPSSTRLDLASLDVGSLEVAPATRRWSRACVGVAGHRSPAWTTDARGPPRSGAATRRRRSSPTRLVAAGWTILGRNVHVGRYELDLVAVDPGRRRRSWSSRSAGAPPRLRPGRGDGRPPQARPGPPGGLRPARARRPAASCRCRFDLVVVEPGERGGEPRIRHHRAAI